MDTGTTEQVRQLADCGGTMYAVGTFTEISGTAQIYAGNNVFSFSATAPFTITAVEPRRQRHGQHGRVQRRKLRRRLHRRAVHHDRHHHGQEHRRGGHHPRRGRPRLQGQCRRPGRDDPRWTAATAHLLTGGFFKGINSSSADPYYASLNPATGKNDSFLDLGISGHITFKGVKDNSTQVYNQQLSHGGTLDLVEGDFTSVGGLNRQQIFMINLSGTTATVTGWTSPEFDGSDPNGTLNPDDVYFNCGASHPFYIRAAAWSPDDSDGLHRRHRGPPL